jgi:hypothetical protein
MVNSIVTNFEADHRESMLETFASSNEKVGHDLETSYRGKPIEEFATLQPFLFSEAFPHMMPNYQSTNEVAVPEENLNLLPANGGTTFGTFLQLECEPMVEHESHSGEMDMDVDMICYGMVGRFVPSILLPLRVLELTLNDLLIQALRSESTISR